MKTLAVFCILLCTGGMLMAQSAVPAELEVGQPAPAFELKYATKESISRELLKLADFLGKRNVVLAFYPADWSSGCTKEVCTMRDDFGNLDKLNAEILAISGDYVYSHHEWAKHHNLPFKLLSDHLHNVAKAYNSYNSDSGMNKRTMFVVDKEGKLAYIDLQYSVGDDADFNRLKEALEKLQ